MTKQKAKEIYQYLLDKNMGFCFYNGQLVSREDCLKVVKA